MRIDPRSEPLSMAQVRNTQWLAHLAPCPVAATSARACPPSARQFPLPCHPGQTAGGDASVQQYRLTGQYKQCNASTIRQEESCRLQVGTQIPMLASKRNSRRTSGQFPPHLEQALWEPAVQAGLGLVAGRQKLQGSIQDDCHDSRAHKGHGGRAAWPAEELQGRQRVGTGAGAGGEWAGGRHQ